MKHTLPLLTALLLGCGASSAPRPIDDDFLAVKLDGLIKKDGDARGRATAELWHQEDWADWRGPERTGVSRDKDLPAAFDVLWKAPFGGRSTPVVQKGKIYFIAGGGGPDKQLQERVLCLDEADGKKLWEYKFNVWHTGIVRDRLGWTNMVGDPETDTVFAHGTQGMLYCFNNKGDVVWSHSLTEEYGRISGYGGRLTSPIVDGDLLILGMLNASWGEYATGGTRFVAFDKRTGKVVWWASTGLRPKDTFFSTPVVAVIGGQRLMVCGGGDGGVHAFKVRTGEKVWSYVFGTGAVNCSPVIEGDKIWIAHGEPNDGVAEQGRIVCLDGATVTDGKPKLLWQVDGIKVKFASPILFKGDLFVCNELGKMYCLDAATGDEKWTVRFGKNTMGSPVYGDGKIYIGDVDKKFTILKPGKDECEKLHEETFEDEINGSPAIANGRVYFMTGGATYCLGKKDHTAKPDPIPEPVKEKPGKDDVKPAFIQVEPGEEVLHANGKATFTAKAYDDHGRLIGPVKADWSLAPPGPPENVSPPPPAGPPLKGKLSEESGTKTTLTVDAAPPGQQGHLVAKVGGLTGAARVRVAPTLPYKPDFAKLPERAVPGGWVNAQGKFFVKKLTDGSMVLSKRNDVASPLVAKANAYISLPGETNYTIEAEVLGTKVGPDLPDLGVVANRYTLMFAGNSKQLKLGTWDALPRIDESRPFALEPDVWYKMKLTVEVEKGKAVVKGKVWKAADSEPTDWTIAIEDETPNTEGAAALFGSAAGVGEKTPGTDIYFRNVAVTPNKK